MTRIIAGAAGGRSLVVPKNGATRPTADKVREALFSRLEHGGWLEGARVLDLYAGTGALGLEAASRGAAHVLLVENAPAAVTACRRNAALVASAGVSGVEVRPSAVGAVLAQPPPARYDLALLDPPYDLAEAVLAGVLERLVRDWLVEDAMVVVERGARAPEPRWPGRDDGGPALVREEERRYGDTVLWLARRPVAEDAADPRDAADAAGADRGSRP